MTMNQPQTKLEQTAALVRLWWASATLDDFCEESGLDRRYASNWAASLRKSGVHLKDMPRAHKAADELLTRSDMAYLRRLSEALANGEDLTLEVYQQQEPEVVDQEEAQRALRIRLIKEAADRQRQKVAAARGWGQVNGDEQ